MTGIVKILLHVADTFVQRWYVAFVAHHFAFTFLNFEFARFAVWRGALKIRVSLVRFQSRPPDTPHSFARGCGVFLLVFSVIHAKPTLLLLATRCEVCSMTQQPHSPKYLDNERHADGKSLSFQKSPTALCTLRTARQAAQLTVVYGCEREFDLLSN